jgi:hypothetical protein
VTLCVEDDIDADYMEVPLGLCEDSLLRYCRRRLLSVFLFWLVGDWLWFDRGTLFGLLVFALLFGGFLALHGADERVVAPRL